MTHHSQSPQPRWPAFNNTASTSRLPTIHESAQDVVASGTVANRVRFLQNFAIPNISAPPPPVSNHPRENSRTGYGRRISNRFGPPALQTTNPDEQREIDTSHSFLGLNTPRTNHEKEHGMSGYGHCNIGISAQIRPQGRVVGTQYDAAAPWGILSRRKSSRSTCRQCPSPDPDVLKEMNSSGNRSRFSAPVSIFPTSQNEDPKSRDMHPREAKSRQGGTVGSEASFVTTSTIRRQSVRDLFKDYGIERPAGLASSEEPPKKAEIAPRPTRLHRFCHICTGVDSGPSSQCWTKSSLPITRKEASLDYKETISQKDPETSTVQSVPKENRLRDEEMRKWSTKPYPTPLRQPVKEEPSAKVKKPSLPTKFPDFSEPKYPQKNGNQDPQRRISFRDQARPVPIQPGSQTGRCVKDSPFLVADSFSVKHSSVLLPVGVRRGSQHNYHGEDRHRDKNYVGPHMPSPSSSDAADCSNSECRATHRGHAPYRHAIFCTRKNQNNRYLQEETDKGYVADTSYTEECTPQLSHAVSQTSINIPHNRSYISQIPRLNSCSPRAVKVEIQEHPIPEFVECRGYPQTGHSRHRRSPSPGIDGECQHCSDDCQCASCQNTLHRVRCCVHSDHNAIVHQHHTPRQEEPAPNSRANITPTRRKIPRKDSQPTTVTPSRSNVKISNPAPPPDLQQPSPLRESLVKKLSLQKAPSLPQSKRSSLMKETNPKPPTPPPHVSNPRAGYKPPSLSLPQATSRTMRVDPPLGFEPTDCPPPSITQRTIPRLPPTWDETSPERSAVPTRQEDYTSPPSQPYEPDSGPEQRKSPPLPSRKDYLLTEKYTLTPKSRACSSTQLQISPSGSRKESTRRNDVFPFKDESTVPMLRQKLSEHQEELKKSGKGRGERVGLLSPPFSPRMQSEQVKDERRLYNVERKPSVISQRSTSGNGKKWRLRLVDRRPSPCCEEEEEGGSDGHRLSDDEIVHEDKRKEVGKSLNNHDCVWKHRFLEGQNRQTESLPNKQGLLDVTGITLVIHLEGREDLVINANSWKGGGLEIGN
jgi:hypothetical protein